MNNLKLFAFVALNVLSLSAWAQSPIFNATQTVEPYGDVSSFPTEQVANIIDGNVNTKFIDTKVADGMGFTVTLPAPKIAASITITTANDAPLRDPTKYEVLGSNDKVSFTSIANGSIPCIGTRFFARNFTFTNTTAYTYYRIVFRTQCGVDPSVDAFQLSEVQLSTAAQATAGSSIPTMSQWGLLVFGLLVLNFGLFFVRQRELI